MNLFDYMDDLSRGDLSGSILDKVKKILLWLLCFVTIWAVMLLLYKDRTPPDRDYQESPYYDTGL